MSHLSAEMTIRTKILAILLQDARKFSGKTIEECSKAMGITSEQYQEYETGQLAPSLPEIETFAFFLHLPVEHFWGNQTLAEKSARVATKEMSHRRNQLRQKMIGAILRKARQEAGLSLEDLGKLTEIEPQTLNQFELGENPISLPELETLSKALNTSLTFFTDQRSPFGQWYIKILNPSDTNKLTKDLQNFVYRTENQPYLELAKQISQIPQENLQGFVDTLSKITR